MNALYNQFLSRVIRHLDANADLAKFVSSASHGHQRLDIKNDLEYSCQNDVLLFKLVVRANSIAFYRYSRNNAHDVRNVFVLVHCHHVKRSASSLCDMNNAAKFAQHFISEFIKDSAQSLRTRR